LPRIDLRERPDRVERGHFRPAKQDSLQPAGPIIMEARSGSRRAPPFVAHDLGLMRAPAVDHPHGRSLAVASPAMEMPAVEMIAMKTRIALALVAAFALPLAAHAAPCKDSKGKFVKCAHAAATAAPAPAPVAAPPARHAATHRVAALHHGPCRDPKTGRFTTCS